jgi:inner membrane protein
MDNVTHTLTGLMLSRAGLDRFTPNAALMLMLAANVPDIDVVTGLAGPVLYLDHHRGFTHAIAFTPLMAALPPLLVGGLFRRKIRWLPAWLICIVAVISHLLLDYTNTYGIRLFLPFSSAMPRLDIAFVADPWILASLLLAIAAPFLSRLVSSEIGAKASKGRGWAWFALVFMTLYLGGRILAHERAIQTMTARLYRDETPRRVSAIPSAWSPLTWQGVIETDTNIHLTEVNLLREFDPERSRVYQSATGAAIEAAKRNPLFAGFLRFNQLPLWRAVSMPDPEGAMNVELLDLRFGTVDEPGFVASGVVLPSGAVEQVRFSFRGRPVPSR